ncbi:MAG: glycerol-3-phosphate acyltransferase [Clostridia bacterium]|nr:glycerol-3-phosphate acyltransferase [Clostridia bacterium]
MIILLYVAAVLSAYLISGLNPAIIFSKTVYGKDIRTMGSGNPGFTNFRRSFGNRWAWWVLTFDLTKSAVVVAVFALLFKRLGLDFSFGAAFTGFFAILGHAYPVWYKFKGGKGFLAYLSVVYIIDWRAGLIATVLMLILLFTTRYMSLATILGMLTCPVTLILVKADLPTIVLCTAGVLFMTWRHKENIKRLFTGTETKFVVRTKKA